MEFAKKFYIPTHILPSPVIVPIAPIYVKDARSVLLVWMTS